MNDVIWKPNTAPTFKRRGKLYLSLSSIFEKAKKFVLWFVIIIPLLVIGLFFLIRYLASDKFKIQNIGFFGAVLTSEVDLEAIQTEFRDKNIFLLRTAEVEERMREKGAYVASVYVEKILPNSLEVHIEEKSPGLVYIDFTNAYLVTFEAEVIDTLSTDQQIQLNDQEIAILKGFGDPNDEYVIDRILSSHPELQEDSSLPLLEKDKRDEEREEFVKGITEEEKRSVLDEIQGEILAKIEQVFAAHDESVKNSRFSDLPKTYIFENKKYEIGDNIEKERIDFFMEVVDFIDELAEFKVSRYQWDSTFKLSVHLSDGKKFYFSTKRDFKLQSEDLLFVLNEIRSEGKSFRSIDVGSEKVVVEK